MKYIPKTWGFEIVLVNTELYCAKLLFCLRGKTSSEGRYHYHPIKDETFVGLLGELMLDTEYYPNVLLRSLEEYRIGPNVKHRFTSRTTFCLILEVSTTDRETDSIRCEK